MASMSSNGFLCVFGIRFKFTTATKTVALVNLHSHINLTNTHFFLCLIFIIYLFTSLFVTVFRTYNYYLRKKTIELTLNGKRK